MSVIGYLVGSHVVYQHECIPTLLDSMAVNGIDRNRIVITVNGSNEEHQFIQRGILFVFRKPELGSHFIPVVDQDLGPKMGVTHWFYLNCTSRCGPRFKELVEKGFDPEADATLAGPYIPVNNRGTGGRAINDLCMYRHDYLMSQKAEIMSQNDMTVLQSICEYEGLLYALAPKQAQYPNIDYKTEWPPKDIYGTGTGRITEYFAAIDWYRYKKNWGHLTGGTYKMAAL